MADQPSTTPPQDPGTGRWMGALLLAALFVAVSIAISLAVQTQPERASRETPRCGGLYSECCTEWDDNWGPCIYEECADRPDDDDRDDDRDYPGLFDAEENFAERRLPSTC